MKIEDETREQWIRRMKKNGVPSNSRKKEFIRSCTSEQLRDPKHIAVRLSEINCGEDSEIEMLESSLKVAWTKEQTAEIIRKLLTKVGTDVHLNDIEKYGNGDQSLLIGKDLETKRQVLRNLWVMGGDIEHHLRDRFGQNAFSTSCVMGNATAVEEMLQAEPLKERRLLMRFRETSMRLSLLLLVVALSNHKPVITTYFNCKMRDMDHVGVFRTLIKHGARPDANDVTGRTVCHYGAGSFATAETLEMAKMVIKAAGTCTLFGERVNLNGLPKEEYNGMQGTLGGYVVDKERRVVYPVPGFVVEHELALKLENIFVQIGGKEVSILEKCANAKNLVNIID